MWLSKNGNVRMDKSGNNRFTYSTWNERYSDWELQGEPFSAEAASKFARQMHMTEYPDVPDEPPEVSGV